MQAFLCYAPSDDLRPDPFADRVLTRATQARLDEIKVWMKPRLPTISDEEVRFALAQALRAGGADGFRATCLLKELFLWPADMTLCGYVRDTCNALAFALRVETRIWSVRAGVRFPGKSEDRIEWMDDQGRTLAGKVISVDPGLAIGIVQAMDGVIRMGPPRRVFAETVTANITQARYPEDSLEAAANLESRLRQGLAIAPPEDPDCPHCFGEGVIPLPDQDMLGTNCEACGGTGKVDFS
jgi:hypothetical protein